MTFSGICSRAGYALACACLMWIFFTPPAARAAQPQAAHAKTQEGDAQAALQHTVVRGPADVPLQGEAVLHLPADAVFLPKDLARKVLETAGNTADDGLLGIIAPADRHGRNWVVVANYDASGFVKDDEADKIDADKILKSMRAGTERDNLRRADMGLPAMDIVGWLEKPHYDKARHQLIWAIETRDVPQDGQAAAPLRENGVNYNTFSLGRHGYISFNLLTARGDLEQDKPHVAALLAALDFDKGKTYADFDAGTDKVATFGLLALIGGLAVKKIGLFALAAGFAAKFAKILAIAAAAVVAMLKKFFRSGARDETLPPQT